MKKIISLSIIFIFLLTSVTTSLANSPKRDTISSETVITEDNVYDVLDYLGIAHSKFIKSEDSLTSEEVTVGDLSKAIEKYKKIDEKKSHKLKPKRFKTKGPKSDQNINTIDGYYRTVYSFFEGSFCEIGISGSGEYYLDVWREAGPASVFINSDDLGYTTNLKDGAECLSSIDSAFNLKVEYNFTTESFFIAEFGLFSMGEVNYEGFIKFPSEGEIVEL